MRRFPVMFVLGAIVLLLRTLGVADLSSAEAAKPTLDVGVQAATPPALIVAADRVAPLKLPCPYCPKKQKQSGCVAPSAMPLAQASDTAPLIADMAPMEIRPPLLAGIAQPPDPPPPKS